MDSAHPPGRVVRLHFTCRAELPIGSQLRVTGSTLWAPTSLTSPQDPMNAHHIAHERTAEAFPVNEEDVQDSLLDSPALYTSSVEMVTTPDTYPIWKTRRPVVVVLHKNAKQIQHHYYRYLVVTPGASLEDPAEGAVEDTEMVFAVATTNEFGQASPVMMWENPFATGVPNTASSQSLADESSKLDMCLG